LTRCDAVEPATIEKLVAEVRAIAPGVEIAQTIHAPLELLNGRESANVATLRGMPVAVGGSRERGVVAAASYEARRFGVRSAMPSVTAKRQCPDLIFVKPRFEVYKAVSQQIREIFAEHTPIIERCRWTRLTST